MLQKDGNARPDLSGRVHLYQHGQRQPGNAAGRHLGGTWAAYAKGRTLVGDGDGTDANGTTLRFSAGGTGGEYYHTLTTDEIPAHTHQYRRENSSGDSSGTAAARASARWSYAATTSTGGGERHNNIQPYVSVYIWRRTA